jgi:hypothetical protein
MAKTVLNLNVLKNIGNFLGVVDTYTDLSSLKFDTYDFAIVKYNEGINLEGIYKVNENNEWIRSYNLHKLLSAGTITTPSITDNLAVDGTVTIGTGSYVLQDQSDASGILRTFYDVAGTIIPIADFPTVTFIIVNYNNGTPILTYTTDRSIINESTIIPVFTMSRVGTQLRYQDWNHIALGQINKLHARAVKTDRFPLEEKNSAQFVVTTTNDANKYVSHTGGTVWLGTSSKDVPSFTSETDQMYILYMENNEWTADSITGFDNLHYNDPVSGLVEVSNNDWVVQFVYAFVSNTIKDVCIVPSKINYKKESEALKAQPTSIPDNLFLQGKAIGRIVVQKGSTSAQCDPIINNVVVQTSQASHNQIPGVQGGDAALDQFYHLPYSNYLKNVNNVPKEKIGFENKTDAILAFDDATRTFSITPVSDSFSFYNGGLKHTKTEAIEVMLNNATAGHFISFDVNGNVLEEDSFWDLETKAPCCYIYYNATLAKGIAFEERHSCNRDVYSHREFHQKVGTYYNSGFALSGYTEKPSSPIDEDNRWDLSAGDFYDEDIYHYHEAFDHLTTNYVTFYRQNGDANWYWSDDVNPFKFTTGSYINYNQNVAGIFQQAPLATNKFVIYWVFEIPAINDLYKRAIIQGQKQYDSEDDAITAPLQNDIDFGDVPFQEMCPLYKVIFRTSASYSTIGKCRIASVHRIEGSGSQFIQTSYVANSHNSLTNLAYETSGHTGFGRLAYSATTNPTINNDGIDTAGIGRNFRVGDYWINTNTGYYYICVDNTTSNAIWELLSRNIKENYLHSLGVRKTTLNELGDFSKLEVFKDDTLAVLLYDYVATYDINNNISYYILTDYTRGVSLRIDLVLEINETYTFKDGDLTWL